MLMTNPPLWYRQFWPWFLLFIPVLTVVVSMFFIFFANQNAPDLVIDDYYKKGKAIDIELSQYENAKELELNLQIHFHPTWVEIRSNQVLTESELNVSFYHHTLAKYDFELIAKPQTAQIFVAKLPEFNPAKWTMIIHSPTRQWKLKQSRHLPESKPFIIQSNFTYGR